MIRHLGVPCLVSAALLVGACKQSPEPATPPVAPAAPEPAKTGESALRMVTVNAPPFVLSYFQDAKPSGCTWVRLASAGARQELLTVDAACGRLTVAWSPDGAHGAVLDRGGGSGPVRAWTVDVEGRRSTPLVLPAEGHTDAVGFDVEGRLVALVAHTGDLARRREGAKEYFLFEGKKIPLVTPEGGAGLAHAFRQEGSAWKRVETVATEYETGAAAGTNALEFSGRLVSSTARVDPDALVAQPLDEGSEDAARLDAVVKSRGHSEFGAWARLDTQGGPLYAWQVAGEFPYLMMPVRWEVDDGHLSEPAGLTLPSTSSVDLLLRGDLLLVSGSNAARVYDVNKKKRVAALDGVHGARFWPEPGKATPPEATAATDE